MMKQWIAKYNTFIEGGKYLGAVQNSASKVVHSLHSVKYIGEEGYLEFSDPSL